MHSYKPESQRVPQEYRQLSLKIEKKPLSSHDRQKLAGGLSGGIDATAHALRVIDVHTVYSAQPIYTLSHAIASSGKVKKLRIDKMMPKLANKAFSEKSTQIMNWERHKEPCNTANWTHKRGMQQLAW